MRKYIDSIRVCNEVLAYTIVAALEKDDKYSVDFFDHNTTDPLERRNVQREIELRVYHNEEFLPATKMGFEGDSCLKMEAK